MTDENSGCKTIKELDKIKSISIKLAKSCQNLAKQAICQVHIASPKAKNHPHYDVTKPSNQHQFDLFYVSRNAFEGNTYKSILTRADVASRY